MSAFQDAVQRLSEDTEARLLALFDRLLAGEISEEAFRALAIALVGQARARAIGLADVSLTAAIEVRTGTATAALGLTVPEDDAARLAKGLSTLGAAYDGTDDVRARVARYGRSEPASAAQKGFVDGLQRRGIPGYRRVLNPGACELCVWLRKAHLDPEGLGYVYPSSKPFHRHEGCTCVPSPAFR